MPLALKCLTGDLQFLMSHLLTATPTALRPQKQKQQTQKGIACAMKGWRACLLLPEAGAASKQLQPLVGAYWTMDEKMKKKTS